MARFGTSEPVAAGDVTDFPPPEGWVVIVPVKPATEGKTRLQDSVADRAELARAIALDTVTAAAAASKVDRVIVVTEDSEVASALRRTKKVTVIGEGEVGGLEQAIAVGAQTAGTEVARAALLGDLPALRPDELDAALVAAASLERAVVPDAEGTGSTLVTARAGATWLSAFGDDSFSRHQLLGCTALDVPRESSLRRDVDTVEHLADAALIGVGPRTTAVLAGSRV